MRLYRRDSKYTLYEAQFSNLLKPPSGTSDQSNQSPRQPAILTNSQSRQFSLCWSTSDQPVCQTVSQDSYVITQLVNK